MVVSGCILTEAQMPYNRPIPDPQPRRKSSGGLAALVQAEKLMQIALLLPSAVGICWLAGAWLDRRLHQDWIAIAGIIFGAVAGLVGVVRMAIASEKDTYPESKAATGDGKRDAGLKP